jgi:membrane protein implicated in regulation of membrane protease activity
MSDNTPPDEITKRDVYQTFWKCRDFEITNLWQRSILLTAFLIACFTAYASLLPELLESEIEINRFLIISAIAFFLALVGIVFSIIWIKMAKGSKAWFEVYEGRIIEIEKEFKHEYMLRYIHSRKKGVSLSYDSIKFDVNNGLFSQKGGGYSVSKINIGIGQTFLIIWFLIASANIITSAIHIENQCCSILLLIGGFAILSILLLVVGLPYLFKSSAFDKKNKEENHD